MGLKENWVGGHLQRKEQEVSNTGIGIKGGIEGL